MGLAGGRPLARVGERREIAMNQSAKLGRIAVCFIVIGWPPWVDLAILVPWGASESHCVERNRMGFQKATQTLRLRQIEICKSGIHTVVGLTPILSEPFSQRPGHTRLHGSPRLTAGEI